MFKKSILVCAVFLIAFSIIECGRSSESSEELSSAEKKLSRSCVNNRTCDTKEYGLECIQNKCACPTGSSLGRGTFTIAGKYGKTYTKIETVCLLTFDATCKLSGRDNKYDRCDPNLSLTCDATTLKCVCKSGAWNGTTCA